MEFLEFDADKFMSDSVIFRSSHFDSGIFQLTHFGKKMDFRAYLLFNENKKDCNFFQGNAEND